MRAVICLWAGMLLLPRSASSQAVSGQPLSATVTSEQILIAGVPYETAQAIVERHRDELTKVPGVEAIRVEKSGILITATVYTNAQGEKPTALPLALQALPSVLEGLPVEVEPFYVLPPPPGVILVRTSPPYRQDEPCPAGFVRDWYLAHYVCYEQAETCPYNMQEERSYGWRFCLGEYIPAVMAVPIAGIPYYEAQAINARHQQELMKLPGVTSVGLGAEGIEVGTSQPALLPAAIEGLPVKAGQPMEAVSLIGTAPSERPIPSLSPQGAR